MTFEGDSQNIQDLVNSLVGLANANKLTGLWDHVRFAECKKNYTEIDTQVVVQSERNSRKNVEMRAHFRRQLDLNLKILIERSLD